MRLKKLGILLFVVATSLILLGAVYADPVKWQDVKEGLRSYSLPGYVMKFSVKDIEYRYTALGTEPFFLREVGKYKLVVEPFRQGIALAPLSYEIELNPGEKIADRVLLDLEEEGSFIFYGSDRSLSVLFREISSSKPVFDGKGRLASIDIKGTLSDSFTRFPANWKATFSRSSFKYDFLGKVRAYDCQFLIPTLDSTPRFPMSFVQAIKILSIYYDPAGKVNSIVYKPFLYGLNETWVIRNISYNFAGDLISWYQYISSAER